ncbi:Gfo/Idh/MocA family protein [Crassaminicella profunda]|uniref:Gfo/Idh/MocA family protein n=1 Tax=Crassaminicella profunda TaxID=1286698 RepID=UPI001CA798AE|nr:Gfo/Idh/MocA family oxidoreductase [Crassaminicella profunda]QZY55553.1 Gfo/Idh/MocA family oxidoreductase [Crassaminicella profunda]
MKILNMISYKLRPVNKGEIPVGIIGTGGWGKNFVRELSKNKNFDVKVCYDINKKLLASQSKKYKFKIADSYYSLLHEYNINSVFIILPNHLHKEVCLEAANAGVNIFLEKPIANNYLDGKDIVDKCNEKNIKLCVGHSMRKSSNYLRLKEIISKNMLGVIHLVEANRSINRAESIKEFDWRNKREFCPNLPLIQLGIHYIDILLDLFGEPTEINSLALDNVSDSKNTDATICTMKFKNSILAYLGNSYSTNNTDILRIYGTKGIATLTNSKLVIFNETNKDLTYNKPAKESTIKNEIIEFYNYISNNIDIDIDGDNALKVIRTFERISQINSK